MSRSAIFAGAGGLGLLALLAFAIVGMGSRYDSMELVAGMDGLSERENECLRRTVAHRFQERRPKREGTSIQYDLGFAETGGWIIVGENELEIGFLVATHDHVRQHQAKSDLRDIARSLSDGCKLAADVFAPPEPPEP